MVSRPKAAANGTVPISTPCPTLHQNSIRPRRMRSTKTPRSSPSSRLGSDSSAVRIPIAAGPADNVSTAINGIASSLTCDPALESSWANQKNANGRFRRSGTLPSSTASTDPATASHSRLNRLIPVSLPLSA